MRAILIDWLVEVHLKFKLMPETLFLTHNLIDRFLSKKVVTRKNLQLVGVTAMRRRASTKRCAGGLRLRVHLRTRRTRASRFWTWRSRC